MVFILQCISIPFSEVALPFLQVKNFSCLSSNQNTLSNYFLGGGESQLYWHLPVKRLPYPSRFIKGLFLMVHPIFLAMWSLFWFFIQWPLHFWLFFSFSTLMSSVIQQQTNSSQQTNCWIFTWPLPYIWAPEITPLDSGSVACQHQGSSDKSKWTSSGFKFGNLINTFH